MLYYYKLLNKYLQLKTVIKNLADGQDIPEVYCLGKAGLVDECDLQFFINSFVFDNPCSVGPEDRTGVCHIVAAFRAKGIDFAVYIF